MFSDNNPVNGVAREMTKARYRGRASNSRRINQIRSSGTSTTHGWIFPAPPPFYPFLPTPEAERLPTHCCDTHHLFSRRSEMLFFYLNKGSSLPRVITRLPACLITPLAGAKGLEIKEGNSWRDAKCGMNTGRACSRDYQTPFQGCKLKQRNSLTFDLRNIFEKCT